MIVNTAYIYMGGGAEVNPNLWQDGVSNYPVEFTDGCSISWAGLNIPKTGGSAIFSKLPLTNFNRLTLSGRLIMDMLAYEDIYIEFYSRDNVLIGTTTAKFSKNESAAAVDIPSSAKIQNARIKIRKDFSYGGDLILSSAVLS